jgi:hypothetical protein
MRVELFLRLEYIFVLLLPAYLHRFRDYTEAHAPESCALPGGGDFCAYVFLPTSLPPLFADSCNDSYKSRRKYIRLSSKYQSLFMD